MEIKKLSTLFVDSSGERQPRHNPRTSRQNGFGNQLRDTADSFEALLSQTRLAATSDVNQRLYMAQMQAQKSALLDEYASTLARLSHDFGRQLGDSGVHLSELIEHAEDPVTLNHLLTPLDSSARLQAEQFIQSHQVQIHSLKLKKNEIQSFPGSLEGWMAQQQIQASPATETSTPTAGHLGGSDDARRYQQISADYQQYVSGLRQQYSDAANNLLLEAQRSMPAVNISLAELMHQIDQPADARSNSEPLQQWLDSQQPLVEQLTASRQQQQQLPSLADWARQQGISHPWLHA